MGRALGGAKNACAHKKGWIEQYGEYPISVKRSRNDFRAKCQRLCEGQKTAKGHFLRNTLYIFFNKTFLTCKKIDFLEPNKKVHENKLHK